MHVTTRSVPSTSIVYTTPAAQDDPDDVKPEGWVDDKTVVDPSAARPDVWDDDMDGEWQPPHVPNPLFTGPWIPKKIVNPEFKGVFKPRQVHTRAREHSVYSFQARFCCVFSFACHDHLQLPLPVTIATCVNILTRFDSTQVANPEYFVERNPLSRLDPVGAVAFELWTTTSGITFDDVVITTDVAEADASAERWRR
jgi:hypothetical protein